MIAPASTQRSTNHFFSSASKQLLREHGSTSNNTPKTSSITRIGCQLSFLMQSIIKCIRGIFFLVSNYFHSTYFLYFHKTFIVAVALTKVSVESSICYSVLLFRTLFFFWFSTAYEIVSLDVCQLIWLLSTSLLVDGFVAEYCIA